MDRKHNSKIVPFAKELRKNMTKEEKHLWYDFLRNYPLKFTRQKVLGKYIADFYCAKVNIVIELDGSQHYEDKGLANDEKRTAYLKQYGIKVIRISNLDVLKNFDGVCMHIDNEVKQSLSQLR
ncbi:MAG: endonuclease domain-containing protein [Clostridia bacterium]|nr:endonuclease domain-containing protein [Clostridia bacterium]